MKPQSDDVWFMRVSPSSHKRGARYAMEAADVLVAQLEASGVHVVNGASAVALELSKAKQEVMLRAEGIQSPHTIAVVGKEKLADTVRQWKLGTPIVIKHARGGSGTGVRLPGMKPGARIFRKVEDALAYVESPDFEEPIDGVTLIQRYAEQPEVFYRLEFVGSKLIYAVKVDTAAEAKVKPGEKVTAGTTFTVQTDFTHPVVDLLSGALSRAGIDVCGVEVAVNAGGQAFVLDMNCCNTNYNLAAEESAGIRGLGCDSVAALLEERVRLAKVACAPKATEVPVAKRLRLAAPEVSNDGGYTTMPDVSRSMLFATFH